ncbi:hypothetical protein RUM43_010122 [Polyplax serrata]|uniref:Uncharacterized protein n=1 Tax=Polyplax serrata TaxID=468196 RepID=A0AAN8S722_POLSC
MDEWNKLFLGQFNMQIQPFACIVAGLLLLSCTLQTSVAEADHGKMKSMAEVLQILQNLDKYYTQAARPSGILNEMILTLCENAVLDIPGNPAFCSGAL